MRNELLITSLNKKSILYVQVVFLLPIQPITAQRCRLETYEHLF